MGGRVGERMDAVASYAVGAVGLQKQRTHAASGSRVRSRGGRTAVEPIGSSVQGSGEANRGAERGQAERAEVRGGMRTRELVSAKKKGRLVLYAAATWGLRRGLCAVSEVALWTCRRERMDAMAEAAAHDPALGMPPPYLYGTHYSTPGYVVYWMARAAPGHLLRLQVRVHVLSLRCPSWLPSILTAWRPWDQLATT